MNCIPGPLLRCLEYCGDLRGAVAERGLQFSPKCFMERAATIALFTVFRVQTHCAEWIWQTAVENSILGSILPSGGIIWKGTCGVQRGCVSMDRFPGPRAMEATLCSHPSLPTCLFCSSHQGLFFFSATLERSQENRPSQGLWTQEALGLSFPDRSCVPRAQEDFRKGEDRWAGKPPLGESFSCTLGFTVCVVCVSVGVCVCDEDM